MTGWSIPRRAVREAGIDVEFAIRKIGATHPNTYKLTLSGADAAASA